MNIRPIARFAELHSSVCNIMTSIVANTHYLISLQAATKGVTPPWFKVRSPHTLLLTGFPAEPKGLHNLTRPHILSILMVCSDQTTSGDSIKPRFEAREDESTSSRPDSQSNKPDTNVRSIDAAYPDDTAPSPSYAQP